MYYQPPSHTRPPSSTPSRGEPADIRIKAEVGKHAGQKCFGGVFTQGLVSTLFPCKCLHPDHPRTPVPLNTRQDPGHPKESPKGIDSRSTPSQHLFF